MHVLHVVGARPNFMKAAAVWRALCNVNAAQTIVHTGQHYDRNMSEVFFRQLEIPEPHVNLDVGSGTHATQTAAIMMLIEPVMLKARPDMVLVYGDVNSTMAAALVCSKLQIRLGHVEAGLRSRDRTMPEEINRVVTDHLCDLLFTPSDDGNDNLLREGIVGSSIHLVGNVMIDTVIRMLPRAAAFVPKDTPETYGLMTLHRPSNVDDPAGLRTMLDTVLDICHDTELIFPLHPRTRQQLVRSGWKQPLGSRCRFMEPLSYLEFLGLQQGAAFVLTDSGGIQEETTFLNVPCLTLRENTERPTTVSQGTNILIGNDLARLRLELERILSGRPKRGKIPFLWDGHAGERIADRLTEYFSRPVALADSSAA